MTGFEVIVLGCRGGPKENNLSGYLAGPTRKEEYICLDAGSLLHGLTIAHGKGHFGKTSLLDVFQKQIKAYLISHCHLDHVLGLVVGSQLDVKKPILGLEHALTGVRDHLFNGVVWPNYGNEGLNPIGQYTYTTLQMNKKNAIPHSRMSVEPFLLFHSQQCPSTAYLVEHEESYLLYFGDTASDHVSKKQNLKKIWERVAPLVKAKKLKGILLECSYLAGLKGPGIDVHLDTHSHLQELNTLAELSGGSLGGLKIIVTHRKDGLEENLAQQIANELLKNNKLDCEFIFPEQGDKILL